MPDHAPTNNSLQVLPSPDGVGSPARARVQVDRVRASGILTPARGYIGEYDFTLNPYSGCGFGCAYSYAAAFSGSAERRDRWGSWVSIKSNAAELITRSRRRLTGRTIYMSSVTDPYQPIELRIGLSHAILQALIPAQPGLVVQTRSPFVVRDAELLKLFDRASVNVTLSTDNDEIRRMFEPLCPSVDKRLATIRTLASTGLRVGVALAPLLPLADAAEFCRVLRDSGAATFVVDPFHAASGRFRARTRDESVAPAQSVGWDKAAYARTRDVLFERLPGIREGASGFAPSVLLAAAHHPMSGCSG